MTADPDGYYEILGLQPTATQALIRAAYRVRAMELHPDRNKDPSATREFQRLQEAFDVLSDTAKRAAYDRRREPEQPSRARESSPPPAPRSSRWEPIVCTRCNAQTALPRYRVFYSVKSFLVTSVKTAHQGVYCARCELKTAARATLTTLLLGWWSIHGFFWTIEALAKNLFAGPGFRVQDSQLLAQQAMYFASIGKMELARAIAIEAYDLSNRKLATSMMTKAREKLGYETPDPLKPVREGMKAFLDATADQTSTLRLKNPSGLFTARTAVQLGLISVLFLAVAIFFYVDARQAEEARERAAILERQRLERAGIERQAAAEVAARKAETLRRLEQPMPLSGELFRYVGNYRFQSPGGLPRLQVTAPVGASYFIKLADADTMAPVTSMFVRAGEVADIMVPFGRYHVTMAAGSTWYGEKMRFGPDTSYSEVPNELEFKIEGDQLQGHELLLTLVPHGNLSPRKINADQF